MRLRNRNIIACQPHRIMKLTERRDAVLQRYMRPVPLTPGWRVTDFSVAPPIPDRPNWPSTFSPELATKWKLDKGHCYKLPLRKLLWKPDELLITPIGETNPITFIEVINRVAKLIQEDRIYSTRFINLLFLHNACHHMALPNIDESLYRNAMKLCRGEPCDDVDLTSKFDILFARLFDRTQLTPDTIRGLILFNRNLIHPRVEASDPKLCCTTVSGQCSDTCAVSIHTFNHWQDQAMVV